MNKDAFLEELAEVLELEKDDLHDDFLFSENSWDSLTIISVMAVIDEQYHIIIAGDDLMKCESLAQLWALIQERITTQFHG